MADVNLLPILYELDKGHIDRWQAERLILEQLERDVMRRRVELAMQVLCSPPGLASGTKLDDAIAAAFFAADALIAYDREHPA